jgi:rhamnopyranosyl-N-acetylglucosaminyl-diphospho-decaprenol beta-1,3/1,4-galactofuranosyltransferase
VIALVVLTHNRVNVLRGCVENVIMRTSELTREIVIWNNASTDGTREYLASLHDQRIRVVDHPQNLAMNGLKSAFELTTQPFLLELDDDVVEAPERWDETLLQAYERLPEIGLLCASIADNPNDARSRYIRYLRDEVGAYTPLEVNGVRILKGSVGGACTMVSRELYDRIGGFTENGRFAYWRPEIPFQRKMRSLGYESAFLVDLEVVHDGGPSPETPAPKAAYYWHETGLRRRKDLVKRVILAVPFAAALNRRFDFFDPPLPPYNPSG